MARPRTRDEQALRNRLAYALAALRGVYKRGASRSGDFAPCAIQAETCAGVAASLVTAKHGNIVAASWRWYDAMERAHGRGGAR
jgi:hypothetical protein